MIHMVALLTPNTLRLRRLPQQGPGPNLRLVRNPPPTAFVRLARSAAAVKALDRAALALVGLAGAMFMMVIGVRLAQGEPPASFETVPTALEIPPVVETGDRLVTVEIGQNLWDIARSIQPEGDVRPLVDSLAQRNGGSAVAVGQQVIVPAVWVRNGDQP